MKLAIRKYRRDFLAIIGLVLVALLVAGVVLKNQRLTLPGWVPFLGEDFYTLKGEFSTAQAVTPGQGQEVTIAGVPVGEISKVELVDGRAVVSMKIKKKYDEVYANATMLLRPRTGLKDENIDLDPGSPSPEGRKPLPSGSLIPVSQTEPDVNLDEILSSLDADSRDYLQLLVHGAGVGLRGNGRQLAQVFKRFDPTARDAKKITEALAVRRLNIARGTHSFQLVTSALAGKDHDLERFVDSSNAVFGAFAHQQSSLRRAIALLPGTLTNLNTGVTKADVLARDLGPTLQALRPGARALGPAQQATKPFFVQTTPIIRDQIRPFTIKAIPTLRQLAPAAQSLSASMPNLTSSAKTVNYALNELAYNPGQHPNADQGYGRKHKEGYLFWFSWANHAGNSIFNLQDGNGVIRRGLVVASCSTLTTLAPLVKVLPGPSGALFALSNFPTNTCPAQSGTGATP